MDGPDAEDNVSGRVRAREFVFLVDLRGAKQRLRGGEKIRVCLMVEYAVRLIRVLSV